MQKIYLIRHGETKWNITMQHTSYTDIDLTTKGLKQVCKLKNRLKKENFAAIFTSPSLRAKKTCEMAGFHGQIEKKLVEWNYGKYEGLTTEQIHDIYPNWNIFEYGALGGESVESVTLRAKELILKLSKIDGNVLLFTHGHFLRAFIACCLGLSAKEGIFFASSNASITILSFENKRFVLKTLNETCHLHYD